MHNCLVELHEVKKEEVISLENIKVWELILHNLPKIISMFSFKFGGVVIH